MATTFQILLDIPDVEILSTEIDKQGALLIKVGSSGVGDITGSSERDGESVFAKPLRAVESDPAARLQRYV